MKKTEIDYTLKIRVPLIFFAIFSGFVITFFISRAERDGVGYAPRQPIPFSHKLHAGLMQIDCQYCHTGVTTSAHATIPDVATCMNCHIVARKDKPDIIKLTQIYESGGTIFWKRVHRIADYAYFNHSVHVNKGIPCESCHGNVENMDVITQVSKFTMAACLDCHRTAHEEFKHIANINNGPVHCAACHR